MILGLPDGYDTRISAGGSRLSGGQKQRLGLARALYGDPVLLVLDEPNANLDADGSNALNAAIEQMKSEGKAVVIMAHRPSGIATCDMLLVLDQGQVKAFGPRDEVLRETVKNYRDVAPSLQNPAAGAALGANPARQQQQPAQTIGPIEQKIADPARATRGTSVLQQTGAATASFGSAPLNAPIITPKSAETPIPPNGEGSSS
jgi:ATP-binding cassette subfamily C protein